MNKLGLWALRFGLAGTYLYSGISLIREPLNWVGFLPQWFISLLPVAPETYLTIQGIAELLFVLSFLSGFGIRWAALLSALEMFGITAFYGIDLISFRDIAIFGAALSLFFFYYESNRE